jgi:hypothetical protein
MKKEFIKFLFCPKSLESLTLENKIIDNDIIISGILK